MRFLDLRIFKFKFRICHFLGICQNSTGGFGGGPGQESHLAPTYAATLALITVGTDLAYKVINRYNLKINFNLLFLIFFFLSFFLLLSQALYKWIMSLKQPDGSFAMHIDGEVDLRFEFNISFFFFLFLINLLM